MGFVVKNTYFCGGFTDIENRGTDNVPLFICQNSKSISK
jgi:hypothetical protein